MKKLIFVLQLFALSVFGADITPGYTFTANEQNVTATKLNNAASGTVNSTFYSTRSAIVAPSGSTYVSLVQNSSDGTYYKITLDNLIYNNFNIISNRSVNTAPSTNAYILEFTDLTGLYEKSTLDKAFFSHDFLINGRQTDANPSLGATFLTYDGGVYQKVARSNLLNGLFPTFTGTNGITNLTALTVLTNNDAIWIWDSVNASNKSVVITNLLVGGFQTSTNATNGDFIAVYNGTTNVMTKVPLSAVKYFITNGSPQSFFSVTNSVPLAGGTNGTNHALGVMPSNVRVTLLCVLADATSGLAGGDEVDIATFYDNSSVPAFAVVTTSNSVQVTRSSTGNLFLLNKATGAQANVTANTNKYVLKIRAWAN